MTKPFVGPVNAVTFDLDFTLWDLTGVLHHAESVAQGVLEQRYPAVAARFDLEGLRQLRDEVTQSRPEIAHDVTALRREALRHAGQVGGLSGDALQQMVDEIFEAFLDARHAVRLYDDAIPLLEALHGKVRLGAITNGNAEVHRLGLDRYFDFALSAVEIGAAKPSRLVFETARNRAGVAAQSVVHVGDDVHSDVTGAANFGMQAVWLNRDGVTWPADTPAVPHHEVASLAELQGMLSGIVEWAAVR